MRVCGGVSVCLREGVTGKGKVNKVEGYTLCYKTLAHRQASTTVIGVCVKKLH